MITVLPQINWNSRNPMKQFARRIEAANASTYLPENLETLMEIDYEDMKLLMLHNLSFFNQAVSLLAEQVSEFIDNIKDFISDEYDDEVDVGMIKTLDDLLNCGYYGDTYESSRKEFISCFLDYLA